MAFSDVMTILLGSNSALDVADIARANDTYQENMAHIQDSLNPFSLGSSETDGKGKRSRKEIYSKWEKMLRFAPISEAMGIHVAAALGGDATTSQQVFITPSQRLRDATGQAEKQELAKLEKRIPILERLINEIIVKVCRDAVGFGDGYARIYGEKGVGIVALLANEYTYPPLIQAYEKINKTVAYHVLDFKSWQKSVSKLNMVQMARLKLPRMTYIAQTTNDNATSGIKTLQADKIEDAPVLPAMVGGSFCAEVEEFYDNIVLCLSALNSQQIADAVNQMFLSINMTAMPPAQRQAYIEGLKKVLVNHKRNIESAMKGGEPIWSTEFHVMPTTNDKQVLNPLGDIKGQRSGQISTETLMINVRLLMGGLGLDPSMVGWADMLAGGLGDGAAFHTSSQIMRRSMMVRQAAMLFVNQIVALDWAYAYGEDLEPMDYGWQVEFYSDQSAATTEELTNKQTRMNTLILKAQALGALKELGLSSDVVTRLLERDGGMDLDEAERVAQSLAAAATENPPIAAQDAEQQAEQDDGQDDGQDDEDGI